MTLTTRGGVSRTLACTALVGAFVFAPTLASAAPVVSEGTPSATYYGAGEGYDGVIDGRAAGTNLLQMAFSRVETFCIEYGVPAAVSGTFTAQAWPTGFNGKAADVAANHKDLGTALADAKAENAAAQLAIWSFTDNVDFSAVPNAEIVARANELVAAAQDVAPRNPTFTATTTSTTAANSEGVVKTTVEVSAVEGDGSPARHAELVVDIDGDGFDDEDPYAAMDDDGKAALVLDTPAAPATVDVYLTANLDPGTVMVPAGGEQAVITAQWGMATMKIGTVDLALPAPAPEPTTEPTPAPAAPAATPTPAAAVSAEAKPKELPYTGALGTGALAATLAAAGVGAAVFAARLRRRQA